MRLTRICYIHFKAFYLITGYSKMMTYHTDGSCNPNPGKGGWCRIRSDWQEMGGTVAETTNNEMELLAIYNACLDANPYDKIVTDSLWCMKAISWEWRVKCHLELLRNVQNRVRLLRIDISRVKWHWRDKMNIRADKLAKMFANKELEGPLIK